MRRPTLVLLALLFCVPSCGSSDTGPTDAELAMAGRSAALDATLLATLADTLLFDLDETLDPSQDAAAAAAAIGQYATAALAGCGTLTTSATQIAAQLGTGCTLPSGTTVAGSVQAVVSRANASAPLSIALSFAATVDGYSLAGTATFSTTDARTFSVQAQLQSSSGTYTVRCGEGVLKADGTASGSAGGLSYSATLTALEHPLGVCFPDAGQVGLTHEGFTSRVVFATTSGTTGEVTLVKSGSSSSAVTLPAYGTCPGH